MNTGIKKLIIRGILTALLCVISPLAIPIGPVPVTLSLFAILLLGMILPPVDSFIIVLLYLVLGTVGLPVFSGGICGLSAILGLTGGYLLSFLIIAPLVSFLCQKFKTNILCMASCFLTVVICYIAGTTQYCLLANSNVFTAVSVCVLPFLPFDIIKVILAVYTARRIKRTLKGEF